MSFSTFSTLVLVILTITLASVLFTYFYIIPNPVLTMPPGEQP